MNRGVSRVARFGWDALAKLAGGAYIAGPELRDAVRTCRMLAERGFSSTTCFWNVEGDPPDRVAQAYVAALDQIASERLDCYLSVKLPPLQFDEALLSSVLLHARDKSVLVHFDSLEPEAADRTFAAIAKAFRQYPHLGCTLPGRWQRSPVDADLAIDLGLQVRVVKGQWQDPEQPDIEPCSGFLKVIDRLAGRARHVAVATHDTVLAREAISRLCAAGTKCVLELLYGLPVKPALEVANQLCVPVCVYVPYGYGWLPYSLSQARRNPRMFWWVLRDMLGGGSPFREGGARISKPVVAKGNEDSRSASGG